MVRGVIAMASSSVNLEGQKKIHIMSLDYIKSNIIRKTSSKSVCMCNKDVGLNIEDEVEHATTDLDSVTEKGECKNGMCKHCGKTFQVPKHKPSFFKFLRERLWWKNNLGADSVNKSSDKMISNASDCSFPSIPSDFKSKDNLNYIESVDNSSSNNITSEVIDHSTKCSMSCVTGDEISDIGASGNTNVSCNDHRQDSVIYPVELLVNKGCGEKEIPISDERFLKNDTNLICNAIINKEIDSFNSQSSEIVPPPSPQTRSLTCELLKLSKYGWYWGPISREEAEEKLQDQPDGAFLVRDSSADHYLLSLSFRSSGKLLHTRIEHSQGLFSFYHQPEQEGFASIGELIDHSVSFSQSAVFCYSRPRSPGHPAFPVRLTKPVSRFTQVRSLQYLCRFVIRQYIRVDNIENLPLPNTIKGYIQEGHY